MGKLDNKVAVITGSDSGIGKAIAETFAAEGADVAVTYFRHDREGAETCRRIEALGRRGILVQLDQRDPDAVARLFEETVRQLGRPDILVNNAGIDMTGTEVAYLSLEDWDRVIRTNLYGPFFCARAFVRERRAAGGRGKIINITSIHQRVPRAGSAAYDCSKAALHMLTRTLSLELAPDHINVNAIAPGMILTPMNQRAIDDEEARRRQESHIPLRRAGKPADVAHLALYLASAESDYVTGQSFVIDGGLELNLGQGA